MCTEWTEMARWPDIENVRRDFPLLKNAGIAYLDNSATSQKPLCVLEKEKEYYENYNANPFRGLYGISVKATDAYEEARAAAAEFIHAAPEEIIFTRNASESLNLAAYSLGELLIREGDEIITSVAEHHSNLLPWQQLAARKGASVRYMEPEADGSFDPEKLREMMNDKVRIVSLTAMSNLFGTMNDVKTLAKIAHESGSVYIADGAQSVPHTVTDVKELDVDMIAFSGHKMLGPMGIGVLYGKKELLEKMPPFLTGGEMITTVTLEKTVYAPVPHKFEAGTVNAGGAIAFAEALRYLTKTGLKRIEEREKMLTTLAVEGIKKIPNVLLIGSERPEDHHGIVTFKIEGVHPHDVSSIFSDENIAVRAGHHCAQPLHRFLGIPSTTRASFMFYNTEEEVERFLHVLASIRGRMGYADENLL